MKYFSVLTTLLAGCMLFAFALNSTRANAKNPRKDESKMNDESKIQEGFDISPVHLNMAGKNRALVGLGSYIVNAQGTCNFCHTCPSFVPGHSSFTGGDGEINSKNYLAGGLPFKYFGVVSRNLTPDSSGHPAGLTFPEFVHTIRSGDDPKLPGHKLLGMPWPIFRYMTKRDLQAVYEYLSAIPHAEHGSCTIAGQ